ncbi:MAG TPA: hypothetical protein VK152_06760 [Paludibacter sp.]|nr:hypothetical protein [Paludibacter sp.]
MKEQKKFTMTDLAEIMQAKGYMTLQRVIHYFGMLYGKNKYECVQIHELLMKFPASAYDEKNHEVLEWAIEAMLQIYRNIVDSPSVRVFAGNPEKNFKKIFYKKNDEIIDFEIDMNFTADLIALGEFFKQNPELISVVEMSDRIIEGRDNERKIWVGDVYQSNDEFNRGKSEIVLCESKGTYRNLQYIPGKGYIHEGKPFITDDREYNSYALSLYKMIYMGNIHVDISFLSEKSK